jgi:ATP-dependent DNA helicase 2 subunit 2
VDPEAPLEPPAEILLRYSKPPEKLIDKAKPDIEALIDAAEVKKGTPPKQLLERYG